MNVHSPFLYRVAVVVFLLLPGLGVAEPDGAEFFEKNVRPILQENCFKCHSHAHKIKGGLALDSLEGALGGGETRPAVVPGDLAKSLLIEAIGYRNEDLQMPPKGKRLTADQIATLTQWVEMGAPWPAEATKMVSRPKGRITQEDRKWWAFQPLADPPLPDREDDGWSSNGIDRFILRKFQESGVEPAPRASKAHLIRRLYFDLIGLPPSPEEVARFEADTSPEAWPRLVDSLLATPRYGERWARHWLDLVRYAESDGFRVDDYRPNAWHYRDYVIAAFNEDKPYNRFIEEQLAGDELFPDDPQARVATGYLRHWIYEYNNRDVPAQWTNILNDVTDVTADVFLGLGLQCARCHDHKFDPLLQKDYYRLQAFFAPILPRDDLSVATASQQAGYAEKLAAWELKTAPLREQIAILEAPYRKKAADEAIAKFPEETQALIHKPMVERTPLEHQLAELAYRQVQYEWGRLLNHVPGNDKQELIRLQKELTVFEREKPRPLPVAPGVGDVGPVAPPVRIPKKEQLGDIAPGVPTILDEAPARIDPTATSTGRRSALARWMTAPENPLVSRVIVNRVWQYHFGTGLAHTASDFGKLGRPPSHPELLDWMARRFMEEGWSFKKLHRLILLSSAWQQSTDPGMLAGKSEGAIPPSASDAVSPEALPAGLLHQTRRLDAEQIRDAILAITGELDLQNTGGPGVDGSQPRRTIFNRIMRNSRDPLLEVFDAPEGFLSASERNTTTTPTQSLQMMNSAWSLARARAFSRRLRQEAPSSDSRPRLIRAFELALGRAPSAVETAELTAFLGAQETRLSSRVAKKTALPFVSEKMPFRAGRGALLTPETVQSQLVVPNTEGLPEEDFTIEAFVTLRSVCSDGGVRTIASQWNGKKGWSFGVTGKQSRYKPQTLVFIHGASPVFSGLTVQIGKPYFVAARLSREGGITFFLKDLSNDDEPMLAATLPYQKEGSLQNEAPFTIGGRAGDNANGWDGVIDDVRLSRMALDEEKLLLTADGVAEMTVGYWRFDMNPDPFLDLTRGGHDIAPAMQETETPQEAAWADLCHVLLNSNEFLYID